MTITSLPHMASIPNNEIWINPRQVSLEDTLKERGKTYGQFRDHAEISQTLKKVMRCSNKWSFLEDDMKEALEMIMHKVARILNGNPKYADSWVDIAGYTQLVANRLTEDTACTKD